MKVLVIRFSSIGDIVLTTPVVRGLKTELDCEVHYCTKESYKSLVSGNPYIDKVLVLDSSLDDLILRIREEKYDYIVDLHNNIRTRIISFRTGIKAFSFNKLNVQKWLMVNLKINKLPGLHIVDRYMETVKQLGVKGDPLGLDYFIPAEDEISIDWLPESHREEYVVYAIGGQHETKKLPLDRMIELCDRMNKPIVLIGGKEDVETGDKVEQFFTGEVSDSVLADLKALNKKTKVFNACGKFNINQSASIIKKAKYVFTHDTGMMHIAAAFKKQVFSIWGNTIPEFGMYPYRTRFLVFENKSLSCRPCSKIGYDKCPKGHFKCMRDLKFDFYLP